MKLKFKKLFPHAILPKRGTPYAAGWDMFLLPESTSINADQSFWIAPGQVVKCCTGIAMAIPTGYFGMLAPRSSAFTKGLWIHGIVDSDYRGEAFVVIRNITNESIMLEYGRSYAQIILINHNPEIESEEVERLDDTGRGTGGFGSTGNT